MEEAVKSHQAEYATQKARKEAKKKRIAEEKKKKKKRTLEYIQQLWDKMLVKDAILLEGAKRS